jgi:nucleotide-binding universal stress UspA family protein
MLDVKPSHPGRTFEQRIKSMKTALNKPKKEELHEPDLRDFGCRMQEGDESAAFKMAKILVPVDFSMCSKAALRYAIAFAKRFNASVAFLNVIPARHSARWAFEALNYEAAIEGDLRREMEVELRRMVKEAVPASIPTSIEIRHGEPSIEIMTAANECLADLIIMSTHGHTGRVHAFTGSVAGDVARLAHCPVLVVRGRRPAAPVSQLNPFKANQKLAEAKPTL